MPTTSATIPRAAGTNAIRMNDGGSSGGIITFSNSNGTFVINTAGTYKFTYGFSAQSGVISQIGLFAGGGFVAGSALGPLNASIGSGSSWGMSTMTVLQTIAGATTYELRQMDPSGSANFEVGSVSPQLPEGCFCLVEKIQ